MNLKNKIKSPFRFIQSTSDTQLVRFEKDHLKEVTSKQGSSFRLEVIDKNQIGTASINQPDVDELIKRAVYSAKFGDKAGYEYPKSQKLVSQTKLFSPKVKSVTPEELMQTGKFLINSLKEINPQILVDVRLSRSTGESFLEISGASAQKVDETSLSIMMEGELVSEGDILSIGDYFGWRDHTFDPENFAKGLKNRFNLAKKIVTLPSGSYPVIFSEDALSTVLDFLITATSAESVYKKVSRFSNDLEKPVADPRFSLLDDPTIDFAEGSSDFDDEGSPSKPLPIIENGVLKNFYTDLKNATRLKISPNGRGFGIPASPSLTNTIISPGQKTSAELIKNIKHGLLIEQVIGGGQDSPYAGDFSLNIHLGFLIKDGQIVGRVKNAMISGNIFEMIKNKLAEISSDVKWYGGSQLLPQIQFEGITIVVS